MYLLLYSPTRREAPGSRNGLSVLFTDESLTPRTVPETQAFFVEKMI